MSLHSSANHLIPSDGQRPFHLFGSAPSVSVENTNCSNTFCFGGCIRINVYFVATEARAIQLGGLNCSKLRSQNVAPLKRRSHSFILFEKVNKSRSKSPRWKGAKLGPVPKLLVTQQIRKVQLVPWSSETQRVIPLKPRTPWHHSRIDQTIWNY